MSSVPAFRPDDRDFAVGMMDRFMLRIGKAEPGRILIVDDDVLLLESITQWLSARGYQCHTAISGSGALDVLGSETPDIVLTDIVLPDMTGLALTAEVKKTKPDMAVIVMTGFIDEFSYDNAMTAGASDFIRKPFSFQELTARIEHARMHERLQDMSIRDELTGLYNRRGFFTLAEHLLKGAKRRQKELCMLYCDLDELKQINDTLGHQGGDAALIDVANVLKETFRDSDVIARISGDEFVVMPIEGPPGNLEAIANRLTEALETHNAKSKRGYRLSVSTGTACFDPLSPHTIDELLSQADKSMYQQKKGKQAV